MKKLQIQDPIIYLNKIKQKITKNDILAILTTFILGIIVNFNFIISNGVSPDALSIGNWNVASEWEISLGRFCIKYIDTLRFGLVNKTIIVIICLCALAMSILFIIRIFKIKNKIAIFLIAAIIAVAPQFTETYMFIYCADAYCIAFLLSTISVYFLSLYKDNKKNKYLIISSIITIIVCSLYQAYLGVIVGLTLVLLIYYLFKNVPLKEVIILAIKYIATILVGTILYYIILKILLSLMQIELATYKGANSLGLETIKNIPNSIKQAYTDFFPFFFNNTIVNNEFWRRDKIYFILYILNFAYLFYRLIKDNYEEKFARIMACIGILLVYPIGVNIMDIISPTNINLVTGTGILTFFVMIINISLLFKDNSFNNILKWIEILLLLFVAWTFILENTYTYMAREQTYNNYYTIASDIYTKVTQLDDHDNKKWMFSYYIYYRPTDLQRSNGFVSANNETWDNYNGTVQNVSFFKKYLGINITICSKKEYNEIIATEEFNDMPVYPSDGSIREINGIIVIKTSELTF